MNDAAEMRAGVVQAFRARAIAILAADPALQSVMLVVAQYWNDQADDEVHAILIASRRELPMWPHQHHREEASEWYVTWPDDECRTCRWDGALRFEFEGMRRELIEAFEAFCRESAHQSMETCEAYLPYAVARRRGDGAEVEVVGCVQRPEQELVAPEPLSPWPDDRARALFDEVCANPADDGPREILADYLQELGDPRGEYIMLALARELDEASVARRDALLAEHMRAWLHPLETVIPAGGARFSRGFLSHAEVWAPDEATANAVRGHAVWSTVESIRFMWCAYGMLDGVMRALREVAVDSFSFAGLVEEPRPWAIESLQADIYDDDGVDELRATALPRLRRLTLHGTGLEAAVRGLRRAKWWWQLERVTVLFESIHSLALWRDRLRDFGPLPWLAVGRVDRTGEAVGWQIAFSRGGDVEISMSGWHPEATFERLRDLLGGLPDDVGEIRLVGSRTWSPIAGDAAWLTQETKRRVALGAPPAHAWPFGDR